MTCKVQGCSFWSCCRECVLYPTDMFVTDLPYDSRQTGAATHGDKGGGRGSFLRRHPAAWHPVHVSFVCVTWLTNVCDMTCVTWLMHMCEMTHAYVWHDSFTCVTWFIHMCDMTNSYVTALIHMCDRTHSYVWRDAFIGVTWRIYFTYLQHRPAVWHSAQVTWRIDTCHTPHSYVWHETFICHIA